MTAAASSRRGFLFSAGAATAGVACGFVLGNTVAGSDADPTAPTEADVGFCTDMSLHHIQALDMCQRVLGRETGDPVQAAAAEVLQTQAIEVGMMRAWLADWGQPTSPPDTVMAWMGMNDGAGMPSPMMPGLASDDEMRELSLAVGLDQGRLWLDLMRTHHVSGVAMAEAAVELVTSEKVQRIARTQAAVQTFEIAQYDELLTTVYA